MPERLSDEYVAQAMQDARRFQGCWDAGTSGTLAAHTFRLAREREELLSTIRELEARNAEMRAAVERRQNVQPVGQQEPAGIPEAFLQAARDCTFVPAVPIKPAEFRPTLVRSSVPAAALEHAWAGVKARRDEMMARARGDLPLEPIVVEEYKPRAGAAGIIGIAGRAGSGKNLVASMIPDSAVIQLADPLYAMLEAMLGIPAEQLRDRQTKELPIDGIGKSPRQLLQTLGTEWGRALVRDDIWLVLARRRIDALLEAGAASVVIADVRFDNEAAMIRQAGGQVWEVVRPGGHAVAEHESERGVSPHLVDLKIHNAGTIEQLRDYVADALASK